eukprot:2422604-Pyramimonas_sp.AAC.1
MKTSSTSPWAPASAFCAGSRAYRSSQAVRDAAPVPDVDAERHVRSLAGRTGAAPGVFSTTDEASDEIAGAIA